MSCGWFGVLTKSSETALYSKRKEGHSSYNDHCDSYFTSLDIKKENFYKLVLKRKIKTQKKIEPIVQDFRKIENKKLPYTGFCHIDSYYSCWIYKDLCKLSKFLSLRHLKWRKIIIMYERNKLTIFTAFLDFK